MGKPVKKVKKENAEKEFFAALGEFLNEN